tara:strand:- start:188 stop:502 length:315 start_codon:yes stop_codon:yes gene_type:complete
MILFWFFYYLVLTLTCYSLSKFVNNKFIRFFFIPVIFGIFGAIWFIEPGKNQIAPIISIVFLEASILESNGINRLLRPMISFIFFLEIISLIIYFYLKKIFKNG